MRRRTEIIGGAFKATSLPGKGTTIKIKIPLIARNK
jgi:signal transduction histidine kinase